MPIDPNDPYAAPQMPGGAWGHDGQWHGDLNSNSQSDQTWLQQNDPTGYNNWQKESAEWNQEKNDPNSPFNQSKALQSKENMLLGRQAPAISQVNAGGLEQARGNQMGALGAQQALMAGPSLAGMRANQSFGQAQGAMMGARDPRSVAAAMRGGAGALGGAAGNVGNAVGNEWLQGQKGIANSVNTLGQGDIASQKSLADLQAKQQQLFLTQRQQNLGAAQGYEQNYYDLQNVYTQAAQAAQAAKYKQLQDQQQQQLAIGVGVMNAVPFIGGAFAAGVKGGTNSAIDSQNNPNSGSY